MSKPIDLTPVEQVVEAVNAAIDAQPEHIQPLIKPNIYDIYRDVLLEHSAIPDMPLAYIVFRHVNKAQSQQETDWWIARGGIVLTKEDMNPSLTKALFGAAGYKL